jgi:hypothetical protein
MILFGKFPSRRIKKMFGEISQSIFRFFGREADKFLLPLGCNGVQWNIRHCELSPGNKCWVLMLEHRLVDRENASREALSPLEKLLKNRGKTFSKLLNNSWSWKARNDVSKVHFGQFINNRQFVLTSWNKITFSEYRKSSQVLPTDWK